MNKHCGGRLASVCGQAGAEAVVLMHACTEICQQTADKPQLSRTQLGS